MTGCSFPGYNPPKLTSHPPNRQCFLGCNLSNWIISPCRDLYKRNKFIQILKPQPRLISNILVSWLPFLKQPAAERAAPLHWTGVATVHWSAPTNLSLGGRWFSPWAAYLVERWISIEEPQQNHLRYQQKNHLQFLKAGVSFWKTWSGILLTIKSMILIYRSCSYSGWIEELNYLFRIPSIVWTTSTQWFLRSGSLPQEWMMTGMPLHEILIDSYGVLWLTVIEPLLSRVSFAKTPAYRNEATFCLQLILSEHRISWKDATKGLPSCEWTNAVTQCFATFWVDDSLAFPLGEISLYSNSFSFPGTTYTLRFLSIKWSCTITYLNTLQLQYQMYMLGAEIIKQRSFRTL